MGTNVANVAAVAYKQAVEKYEAAKMKLLGLTLQIRSKQAALDAKVTELLLTPDFASKGGLYSNEQQRKAALAERTAELQKPVTDLETDIIVAQYELAVAEKWESFFRHTYDATE